MFSMFMALSALAIALGALWFSSELARRSEAGGKLQVQPHMAPLREALHRAEARIHQLTRGLESAEREIALLKAENREYAAEIGLAPPVPGANRSLFKWPIRMPLKPMMSNGLSQGSCAAKD